ncbi:MAG: ETC complex I subunit [Magnetovibrio sp.]|nr:ETC complex I subunit [Magnetovibrio sp.]
MANARIYRPTNNIMQSGKANADRWFLEFEPAESTMPDPLMGWSGSGDTPQQLKLSFSSCDEAKAYAKREGIDVEVIMPNTPKKTFKNYADRFAFGRVR